MNPQHRQQRPNPTLSRSLKKYGDPQVSTYPRILLLSGSMTDQSLEELTAATEALNDARRRRYAALSAALFAGHPQTVVAKAAAMSPPGLSRMLRQDTARSPDQRLLPGLRTGEVNGQTVHGSKRLSPSTSRERQRPDRFRQKPAGNAPRIVNQHNA